MIDTHLRYEHIKDPGMYMALLTDRPPGGRDEFGVFSRTNMREWKVMSALLNVWLSQD